MRPARSLAVLALIATVTACGSAQHATVAQSVSPTSQRAAIERAAMGVTLTATGHLAGICTECRVCRTVRSGYRCSTGGRFPSAPSAAQRFEERCAAWSRRPGAASCSAPPGSSRSDGQARSWSPGGYEPDSGAVAAGVCVAATTRSSAVGMRKKPTDAIPIKANAQSSTTDDQAMRVPQPLPREHRR